jgi:dCTP deaminase
VSILSDISIRQRCVPPTQVLDTEMRDAALTAMTNTVGGARGAALFKLLEQERHRPPSEEELAAFQPMIHPYVDGQVREVDGQKIISYGTSSYGYDVRCAPEFKVFTNINSTIVDPKAFDPSCFVDVESDVCIIPPNSFALARTVEYFRIPRDILVVCLGKSTYARCGIIVNVTPLEPEWEGHVTLEFSNTTPLPARIYANEGVAQFLFFQGDQPCATSYKDRGGKYQGQTGVNPPRM